MIAVYIMIFYNLVAEIIKNVAKDLNSWKINSLN